MIEAERIAEVRRRLSSNEYFLHPLSDANTRDDISYLLELLVEKDRKIAQMEKKNQVLSTQVLELTQEIENVRSDFGGGR